MKLTLPNLKRIAKQGKSTKLVFTILLLIFLAGFSIHNKQQQQIDKIFSSEKFYLTRSFYGSSIYVYDSITFNRVSDSISVSHYKHFPGPRWSNKMISLATLSELRQLFSKATRQKLKKCDGPFFKLHSTSTEIVIWDRQCGNDLLAELEKLTKTN